MTEFVFPPTRRKIGAFAVCPPPLAVGPSAARAAQDGHAAAMPADDTIRPFRVTIPEAALSTCASASRRPAGPTASLSRTSRRA